MKNKCSILVVAVLVSLLCNYTSIAEDRILIKEHTLRGQEYVPGEIIVKFKPGTRGDVIANLNSKHGTSVLSTSPFAGFKRLRIPRGRTLAQMVEIYKRNPNIEYAELNYIAHAHLVPNDPSYNPYQWHLDNVEYGGINMESAWDIETGDPNVIVAVIDTGVAYEDYTEEIPIGGSGRYRYVIYEQAPDLAQTNFVTGYDFVNDDEHPVDDEGHGTHVTGTIARSTNNGIGVAGVAFNCSIMPIKVLDSRGFGTYADIADGIYYASNNGAGVINMSLGGSTGSITLEDAIAYAYGKGVTVVCSSGNNSSASDVLYPAAYNDYCIAVGATRYDEEVAYYSTGGPSLDLTAPGGDVTVDLNGDGSGDGVLQQTFGNDPTDWGYWFYQGTSMAAPHVSGVAALLISNGVATTPDEVRQVLQSTAEDKGATDWDPAYGWGIVDAYAALTYTLVPNDPPVADAGGPYTGTEDAIITFNGSGSYDPDDEDTITYSWDFGDGTTGSGVSPTHIYTAGGTYTVTLMVNDGKVNSGLADTTATIADVNDPPVADAGPDQSASVGETVTFDGSASYDPDFGGSIVSYSWNFGDNTTDNNVTTTHTYASTGTYTVTLTVTDDSSLTGIDMATVTVTEQPAEVSMHVADIAMTTKTAGINVNAIATVTVVDVGGGPVAGAVVSGSWSGLTDDVDSGITGENGIVAFNSDKLKNANGTFTFTVTDVVKSGWDYDNSVKPGASITVP